MNPDTKALAVEATQADLVRQLEIRRNLSGGKRMHSWDERGRCEIWPVHRLCTEALTALTQPPPVQPEELRSKVSQFVAAFAHGGATMPEAVGAILALLPQPPGSDGEWKTIESAPRDGTIFWAWLYQTGIRQMRWATPLECAEEEGGDPEDYDGCFVEVADFYGEWSPKFWLPLSAIPEPSALAASPAPPSPSTVADGGEERT